MNRLLLDFIGFVSIALLGIILYLAAGWSAFISHFENLFWITLVSCVAITYAKLEKSLLIASTSWTRALIEWCAVVAIANIALCGLDLLINSRDDFATVFALTFTIFFVPSVLVSTCTYSVSRFVRGVGKDSTTR